jgi:orotate phosphoribosyltransferase
MHHTKRDQLLTILAERAMVISKTPITLASGKKSDYYIDGRVVTTYAPAAPLIADLIKETIGDVPVDAVGGLTMGADPMLGALSGKGYYNTFIVRKEPKQHGLGKWIEGSLSKDDKQVVIIDDVATSGGSILNTINRIKEEFPHVKIVKVVVLVDREEGAKEKLAENGYTLESLFTAAEIRKKKEALPFIGSGGQGKERSPESL